VPTTASGAFQPIVAGSLSGRSRPIPATGRSLSQTWEDTKLLLVHALGHVRDLIPRSIRVIANGPLAPFVQCYAGRRAERPAQPRVASSGSTDRM
jgi:hypothetical protein